MAALRAGGYPEQPLRPAHINRSAGARSRSAQPPDAQRGASETAPGQDHESDTRLSTVRQHGIRTMRKVEGKIVTPAEPSRPLHPRWAACPELVRLFLRPSLRFQINLAFANRRPSGLSERNSIAGWPPKSQSRRSTRSRLTHRRIDRIPNSRRCFDPSASGFWTSGGAAPSSHCLIDQR